ncbi:MAG: hypothetical protein LBS81_05170 [Endomicrobium sp.]|jgi:KDO2-lipid IV(A) lauroyltransferase|nr:hypothetical protein [Endomicrobium sp.]
MLVDRDTKVPGVFIDFFGEKAWTPSGLAVLALKSLEQMSLVGLDQRIDKYKHKTVVKGPISIKIRRFWQGCLKSYAEGFACVGRTLDNICSKWVWFHERCKTRPKM